MLMTPDDTYLIDSHCHLDFPQFSSDLPDVLLRANQVGVKAFIVPAVRAKDFENLKRLAEQYPQLNLAFGLHPYFIADHNPADLKILRSFLASSSVIAVGEIGLDYQLDQYDPKVQAFYFESQLELAAEFQLPVIIHVRKAHDQVLKLLRKTSFESGGLIHAFNGSFQQAEHYIKLGFKLGFGGALTHPRATKLRRLASELPLSALVLETDAPDMPLYLQKTPVNEPANIALILNEIAELRNESLQDIARTSTKNVESVFNLDRL